MHNTTRLYINGKFVTNAQASIDPSDRGLLLGDGLFETLYCHNTQVINLAAHWQRLVAGARYLRLTLPLTRAEVNTVIHDLLNYNQLSASAGARITLTRGSGPRGISIASNYTPTILITVFPVTVTLTPITLGISDICINEFSALTQFKTLNYLDKIIARQHAHDSGYDDALLINTQRCIVATTSANIFFVKRNQLYTPALQQGALPGTMRQRVITLATQQGISVHTGKYTIKEIMTAEEVFITNSLIGMRAVSRIDFISFTQPPSSVVTNLTNNLSLG